MAYAYVNTPVAYRPKGLNTALWAVQVVLGLMFAAVGAMKVFQPISALVASLPFAATFPPALIRFIGIAELAGAIGLIVPAATRIAPGLTPLAGTGLTVVMVLASVFHLSRGEFGNLPVTILLGALAAFVAWGRWSGARIEGR